MENRPRYAVFYDHVISKVFVGINATTMIPLPSKLAEIPPQPTVIGSIQAAFGTHPHLPFVLKSPKWDGPICRYFRFSVRVEEGGYGLGSHTKAVWKDQEMSILQSAVGLFDFATTHRNVTLPSQFNFYRDLPSSYGYDHLKPTRRSAEEHLQKALFGFLSLMAMVSYGIALSSDGNDVSEHPAWAAYLQDEVGVDPCFVDDLKRSTMNDFTLPRVGAIVDTNLELGWVKHIPVMEKANVPLYIIWPDEHSWQGEYKDIMARYKPLKAWVRAAMQASGVQIAGDCPSSPMSTTTSFATTPPSLSTANVPSTRATTPDGSNEVADFDWEWDSYPTGGPSGLRQGETMDQFFARRNQSSRVWMDKAPEQAIQAAIGRFEKAKEHQVPGKRGATVFVWEVHPHTGEWRRYWVTKNCVEMVFMDHSRNQRRFDPINNCWDCFKGWAPDDRSDEELEEESWDDYAAALSPHPPVNPASSSPAPLFTSEPTLATADPPASLDANSGEPHPVNAALPASSTFPMPPETQLPLAEPMFNPQSSPKPISHPKSATTVPVSPEEGFEEAFMDTLFFRFGFCPHNNKSSGKPPPTVKVLRHLQGVYVVPINSENSPIPSYDASDFVEFTNALISSTPDTRLHQSLEHLWDLSAQHCDRLVLSNRDIHIEPINIHSDLTVFSLNFKCDGVLQLIVDSPTTALECVRREFSNSIHAARRLVTMGIPFNLYGKARIYRGPAMSRPDQYRPPYRNMAYSFDSFDYHTYEAQREVFFGHPHARAALLAGGITWRLALENIPHESAISGPSVCAHHFGKHLVTLSHGTLIDDELTDNEFDLISGVYKVYTGNGQQTSDSSWWPKQSTWMKSTLWPGYWTQICENWYQRRLDAILTCGATPLTASKWASALRRSHDTQRLHDGIASASRDFLFSGA
jgi:hypothetical protein